MTTPRTLRAGYTKQVVEPVRRIGVSEILRLFLHDTKRRIEGGPGVDDRRLPPIRPVVRDMARALWQARRTVKRLEKALRRRGLAVNSGASLSVSYEEQGRRRNQHKEQQVKRLQQAQILITTARLELLEIPPRQTKAYLLTLQKKLAAI